MLISDLEYLQFANESKSINGGETSTVFSAARGTLAASLRDAPPGKQVYNRNSILSVAEINDNNDAFSNSSNNLELSTITARNRGFLRFF